MKQEDKTKAELLLELQQLQKEIDLLHASKEKRAAELALANIELAFENEEKAKRAAELIIANLELTFENEEKAKRAAELVMANIELAFQNEEKANRTAELVMAHKETNELVIGLRQAEEARRESEERFKALHNASFGGIAIHDNGKILECNQGLVDMMGYTYDELKGGMDGLLLIAPDSRPLVRQHIASGYEKPYEAFGLRKNGEVFPMRLEARNVPYKGKMVRTVEFRDLTEAKQAEEALNISHQKFQSIFNNLQDAFFQADMSGNFTLISPSALPMYGYASTEELMGMPAANLYADASERKNLIKELSEKGVIKDRIIRAKKKNGTTFWVSMNIQLTYKNGKVSGTEGVVRDITGRKQAEEAVQKSNNLLKSMEKAAKIGAWEFNAETMVQTWSDEIFDILEIDTTHGTPDVPEGIGFIAPEYQPMAMLAIQRAIEFGEPYNQEWEVITTKGNSRWINAIATPFQENGKTLSVAGSFQDITGRKQAEAALAQSRAELKAIYDFSPVMMCLVDEKRKIIFANPAFTALTGTDEKLLQGGHACGVFGCINALDDVRGCGFGANCQNCNLRIAMADTLANGTVHVNIEHNTTLLQNGETREVSLLGSTVLIKNNGQRNLLLCLHDITQRKQAEEAIKENEERYGRLLHNLEAGIVVHAPDTSIVMNNPRASELLGLSNEQMRGKVAIDPAWKFIHEDNTPLAFDEYPVNRIVAGKKPIKNQELGICHPDKKDIIWVNVSGFPVQNSNGDIIEIVISFIEITKRKLAEQALKDREEKFRHVFESANVGKSITLPTGEINVNRAFCDMLGYAPEELQKKKWQELTPADEIDSIQKETESLLKGEKQSTRFIKRYIHKNGSFVWADVSVVLHLDSDNKPLFFITTVIDISERKQVEEELHKSESKYGTLFNTMQEGFALHEIICDAKGKPVDYRFLDINPAFEQLTGLKKSDVIGKTVLTVMPNTEKLWIERYGDVALTGNPVEFENYSAPLNRHYQIKAFRPAPNQFAVIFSDITQRKQAEEALIAQQQLYEQILEQSLAGYWDWDIPTGEEYLSPTFKKMFGYEDNEIENKAESWQKLIFAEDLPGVYNKFKQHTESKGKIPFYNEVRYHHKNGATVWVICTGKVNEWDKDGNAKRMIGCHIDITERKQAEEELRTSESLLHGLFDNIPDGAAIYQVLNQGEKGSDYIIKYFNKASLKIENKELSNVIGKSLLDLRPNIDQYGLIPIFKKVWKTGKQEFFPSKIYVDKKFSNYYENTVFKIPTGEIVAIYTDVTEQKQNEEKIAQHTEELSKLNQFSIDLASLSAHDNIEEAITKKIKEMSGAETSIFSVYNPTERTLTVKEIDMEPGLLEKSVGLLGKQIKKMQTQVDEKMYLDMTREIVGVRQSLHEVSFGSIPRPIAAGLQALLKVDRFVGIAYIVDDVLYGTSLLTMKKGQTMLSREILENFINLAAVSLQRRRAEESLKESEEKYRTIFDNVQDVFYQTNLEGIVLEISPSIKYFTEFNRDEIIGYPVENLYNDPKDREPLLKEIMQYGELKDYELKLKTKEGVVKHVSVNARMIRDNKGIPHHIDGSLRDVTDRKLIELAKEKEMRDLKFFHSLTVDRELKMIELKKEINALARKLGEEEDRYKVSQE